MVSTCHDRSPLSSLAFGRVRTEVVLRQRVCRTGGCGQVFWICRHCDRGQHYCSMLCRQQARRQQRRLANRRYQQTPYGRDDHRDRQREYRRRRIQARVTDLSSLALSSNGRIPLRRSFPMLDPHGKGRVQCSGTTACSDASSAAG
jgi:hypothetical protein